MATIIKIKNSGTSGSPSAVATGEFAYSFQAGSQANGGDRLYIGTGTETAGAAANIEVVGGKYFTDMLDHVHGTLTADSGIITDANNKIDVLNVDNITLNGNSITTTDTNGNLTLDPNGTGTIELHANTNVTGDSTFSGNVNIGDASGDSHVITGSVDLNGVFDADNIRIDGNVISSQDTNGNIEFTPNGTGLTIINSDKTLQIPVGTTAQRPTAVTGQIRFNSTLGAFEGYHATAWNSLGGVIDVDQDTFIKAESSAGADNDDITFTTGGVLRATLDENGLLFNDSSLTMQTGNIVLGGTTISTTAGNSTLTLDPHASGATGTVVIEGDLTVNGTQTTVNSTTVTIDDPVFTLAGDTAPASNDGLDKGIEFRWHTGSAAKLGFFGYDVSDSRFKFIQDATDTSGVYSGDMGDVQFGDTKIKDLQFDGTGSGYADKGVLVTGTANNVEFKTSSTDGHVLQVNASGVPFFGHIDCGTY